MACPPTETKYKKMSGFATTKGQMFEVKLAALLFLRGLNSGLEFQLASNVAGAGALDDVVFRLKSAENPGVWTTCFIQLKHKENSRISRKMLTDPKGNFSLQKYCESYVEIKKSMSLEESGCVLFDSKIEDCVAVIYSNANANKNLGDGRPAVTGSVEEFLESDSGTIFSFDPNSDKELDKAVFGCLETFGEDGKDFLRQLRVFCGQPSESEFNAQIKDELSKVDDKIIRDIDIERLCECFVENMSVWCEQSEYILHARSNVLVNARDRVAVETCSARDKGSYRLDTHFEETALLPLRSVLKDPFSVLLIESSECSSQLSSTKLLQAIEGPHLFLTFDSLKLHLSSVTSEWKLERYKSLILLMNDSNVLKDDCNFEMLIELCNFSGLSGKKIVFLSHESHSVVDKINNLVGNCAIIFNDNFQFSQISFEFKRKFLVTKFWLQGHQISMEKFFSGHCDDKLDILNASSFVEITKMGVNLSIGPIFTDIISYYIARTLNKTTVLVEKIFEISELNEGIVILYSSIEDLHSVLMQGDSSTKNRQRVLKKLKNTYESHFTPDRWCNKVSIGDNIKVSQFHCNCVVLRPGQDDQVTAIRIRPCNHNSDKGWFLFLDKNVPQNDIDIFDKFNITRHVLCLENGKLEWIESCAADTMDVVRDHIDKSEVTDVVTEIVTDMKERLMLLCAEPGMGKSTLLSRYAQKTKEALPNFWIILIALNDHTKLLSDHKHTDAFNFLVDATNIQSRLHQSMLELALNVTGNIVILLDGFDEIAPTYVAECCLLLSNLLKTKAKKIWITSRNSIKSDLENRLSTLASKLRKFTEADQRLFFKFYWASTRASALAAGKAVLDDQALEDFISQLIEMTSQAISDREKDFMSIPLQTQMMAEVFADHIIGSAKAIALPDKLDLLQLLNKFIEKKLGIYLQDKLKIKSSDTNYYLHLDTHRKLYLESHMEAALILILGEKDVGTLHSRSIMKNSVEFFKKIGRGEDKTGIIDCVVNNQPRFIHRVFAEYFVAKWFAEHFAENVSYLTNNLYTANFCVVRDIFDRLLANHLELHTAVLNEDVVMVRALLEQGVDVDAKDLGGRTPLHLAAALGTSENQDENNTRTAIIVELIRHTTNIVIHDDVFNATPLWYADITRSWTAIDQLLRCNADPKHLDRTLANVTDNEMISFIITHDLDRLLNICLDNGLGVEYTSKDFDFPSSVVERFLVCACNQGSLQVAKVLIDKGAQIKSTKKRNDMPLHFAVKHGHLEIVRLLCDSSSLHLRMYNRTWLSFLEKILRTIFFWKVESIAYIDMKDHDGTSPLHLAVRHNRKAIVQYLISQGARLDCVNNIGSTPLHYAASFGNASATNDLLDAVFNSSRDDYVKSANIFGDTALHLAHNSIETFKLIADASGNWAVRNYRGKTPLMCAAEHGSLDVVEYLVKNFAKVHNTGADPFSKIDYINLKDKSGATALQMAVMNGFKKVVRFLVGEGADSKNHVGTELLCAVANGQTGVAKVLIEAVADDERANFVNASDAFGNTALHLAVSNQNLTLFDILVKACGNMTAVNNKGQTALMMAVEVGCQYIIDRLLKSFDDGENSMRTDRKVIENRNENQPVSFSKTCFINMKDASIGTALHYAILNQRGNIAKNLIDLGADVRIHGGLENNTALHLAANGTATDLIRMLLDAVAEHERPAYVNACDSNGLTSLLLAVSKGDLPSVEILVKAGRKLTQVDNEGRTLLMLAVIWGHPNLVEYLLNGFCNVKGDISKVQYINICDKQGMTAWDRAKEYGNIKCLTCIEKALLQEGFQTCENQRQCILF